MRRHTLALPLAMTHDSAQHSVRSLVIPKVVLFIAHDLDQGGVETRKKHWISIINASVCTSLWGRMKPYCMRNSFAKIVYFSQQIVYLALPDMFCHISPYYDYPLLFQPSATVVLLLLPVWLPSAVQELPVCTPPLCSTLLVYHRNREHTARTRSVLACPRRRWMLYWPCG